ncbi:class I SAM-dependent methyltransferase [Maribacter polysiphoniae]|uniref:Class I SAM-dependent methyltransferase n=1 Tax=Maribacter polysiphoniae TaxID=429344 RepID=A0A316DTY7_9FLAO|nr:class I SAM-dependent methyltransferase [Maribacter polysiphoniae]MBD1262077.1 class I SAM-dependent methyltransferase [Maribacter polysiphoniae]PWK21767.1 O-methyltransferase [Maribacter polysiphoniae]
MNDSNIQDTPRIYSALEETSRKIGFTMPSDLYVGTLLKTLVASKPKGKFLELGTGMGLSLSWLIDGMDEGSKIVSIDNDPELIKIAEENFGSDPRVSLLCGDGAAWIKENENQSFDLIFADAWPGKYSEIEEILSMVKVGGFYVIDDMEAQSNWPEGHELHVDGLVALLEERKDFIITKMNWSTGLVIAVKKY